MLAKKNKEYTEQKYRNKSRTDKYRHVEEKEHADDTEEEKLGMYINRKMHWNSETNSLHMQHQHREVYVCPFYTKFDYKYKYAHQKVQIMPKKRHIILSIFYHVKIAVYSFRADNEYTKIWKEVFSVPQNFLYSIQNSIKTTSIECNNITKFI